MAKNDNIKDFFKEIIEVIHSKGVTQKIYPYQIPDAIRKCKDSSYEILEDSSKMFPPVEDLLKDIANALRDILGTSDIINAQDFATKIAIYQPTTNYLTFVTTVDGMYLSVNGTRYISNAVIEVAPNDYVEVGVIDTTTTYNASLFNTANIQIDGDIESIGDNELDYDLGEYNDGSGIQTETVSIAVNTGFYVNGDCSITLTPKERKTVTINYPTGCPDNLRIYAHAAANSKYSDWHNFIDTANNNPYGSGSSSYTFNSDDNFVTISSTAYWQPVDSIIDSIYGLDLVYIRAHVDSGNGEIRDIMDRTYRITQPDVVITLK